MSPEIILGIGIGLVVLLLLTGAPFYIAFLAGAIPILLFCANVPSATLGNIAFGSVQSTTLIAIPLFILLGNLMAECGATKVLFDVARAFIGRLPGGLGMAAVLACAMFGAMCGSGVATALAVGSIAVPELVKGGYKRPLAAAICGSSGGLGLIIPPSIGFVILGDLLQISVGDLFIAGILPGILTAVLLCVACYFWCRNKKEIIPEPVWPWKAKGKAILSALPAMLIPLSIMGSIYGGICTPTEAAGVGCVAGILLGIFYFRKLGLKEMKSALKSTARSSAVVFCLIIGAVIFGRVLSFLQIPQTMAMSIGGLGLGYYPFMVCLVGLFLVLGMLFDAFVLVLVCLPPLMGVINSYGIDLIPFAVMFQLLVNVGQVTPPVAITLYAAAAGANADATETVREVPMLFMALLVSTLLLIFIPGLAIYKW